MAGSHLPTARFRQGKAALRSSRVEMSLIQFGAVSLFVAKSYFLRLGPIETLGQPAAELSAPLVERTDRPLGCLSAGEPGVHSFEASAVFVIALRHRFEEQVDELGVVDQLFWQEQFADEAGAGRRP